MPAEDHELEVLLNLDGFEFQFARGYTAKLAVQLTEATAGRPHGINYSLTLHDPAGQRIYGLDNAHRVRRSRVAFDHRHTYGARRIVPYTYRGPVELLEDFYREVERILRERCAMSRRTGTFKEFQEHTLAIARGEIEVDVSEAKSWHEPAAGNKPTQPSAAELDVSDYRYSTLRERIVEHVFVGDVLRALWNRGARDVEVLRSEFDAGGYDLVMSCGKIVRHIQFKSTVEGGAAKSVSVSLNLTEKPSGCVIWIVVGEDLKLKSYRWLGEMPGEPLTGIRELKRAKHAKANSKGIKGEKPNHRVVPVKKFRKLDSIGEILDRLFGPLP